MLENINVLNNGFLELVINRKGAELISLKQLSNKYEFIWGANALVWQRHAPVLFPIVGKLNNNKIKIKDTIYEMGQHGFARDSEFELVKRNETALTFLLKSNEETLKLYPFQFNFYIIYSFTAIQNQLKTTYLVENLANENMYFSVGAHPGFALPVANLTEFEIEFKAENSLARHLLVDGLFNNKTEVINLANNSLTLSKEIFDKDAIVLKNCNSKKIILKHKNSSFKIECLFNDFNDLGIWAKKGNEDFICLEPWLGFSDEIGFCDDIVNKKGIVKLAANNIFEASYYLNFTS